MSDNEHDKSIPLENLNALQEYEIPSSIQRQLGDDDDDDDDDMSSLSSSDSNQVQVNKSKNNTLEPIPYTKSFVNSSEAEVPKPVSNESQKGKLQNNEYLSDLENLSDLESINSMNTSVPYTPKAHPNNGSGNLSKTQTGTTNNTFRRRTSTISSWFKNMSKNESNLESPNVCKNCNHPINDNNQNTRRRSSVTRQLTKLDNINPLSMDRRPPRLQMRDEELDHFLEVDEDELSDELDSDNDDDDDDDNDDDKIEDSKQRNNSITSLTRTDTMIQKMNSIKQQATNGAKEKLKKLGFFDPEFEKLQLAFNFLKGYLFIAIAISIIFAIFWGSMYNRMGRMKNMTTYIVLENENNNNDVPNYISNTLSKAIVTSPVNSLAGWHIKTLNDLNLSNNSDSTIIQQELIKLVHHQKIFAAIFIKPNSTLNYYNSLVNNELINTNDFIEAYYETGANLVSAMSYTSRSILELQLTFLNLTMDNLIKPLISDININDSNQLELLSQPILFNITDLRPVTDSLVSGPQQYGLTYIHLISLLQFQFFNRYHIEIEKKLNDRDFLIFRIGSSLISFLVLSLVYTLVQVYFKINIYSAYPNHLGFLIFWLVTFLIMAALGGVNENVVLYLQAHKPHLISLWMFFWMVWNIAPTYYPFELSPNFYKYAYGFPMKNGFELYKILLFNTYKNVTLARNICVLLAWVILMYTLLPFTMHSFNKKMQIASDEELKKKLKKLKKLKREKMKKKLHLNRLSSTYGQMVDHININNKKVT